MSQLIKDMPNEDYHSTKAVSKTVLDLIEKDGHYAKWAKDCPQDSEKIKTFDFGDAMHAICLEPDRLDSEFVVLPEINLRTNAGKQEKAEFLEANKDKKILTFDEKKQLNLMFESVMAYYPTRELIEADGVAEGSYFWIDEETGLECKCRPDKEIESRGLLVDVKTTPLISKFAYSVDDYRYYVQDPWYTDGVSKCKDGQPFRMEFLVIQKNIECGRYPVALFSLPEDAIIYGRQIYRDNLNRYRDFLSSDTPAKARELDMGYRFNQKADDHLGEVY